MSDRTDRTDSFNTSEFSLCIMSLYYCVTDQSEQEFLITLVASCAWWLLVHVIMMIMTDVVY